MSRTELIEEARDWLGTPWKHQGRLKGVGVDCVGFVVEVARAVGVLEVNEAANYQRRPNGNTLRSEFDRHLARVPLVALRPGDVVLLASVDVADHVALVGDHPDGLSLIHAYLPQRRVVEHRLDDQWRERIVSAYRLPERL